MDQLITIPKLTWPEWQAEYRRRIRVNVLWDRLQKPAPRVWQYIFDVQVENQPDLYYPWYKKGDSRDGTPKKVKLVGKGNFILRIPCVSLGYLPAMVVLDGCHRLRDLGPRILILDCVSVRHDKLKYFNDLLNPHWRKELAI